MHDNQEMLSKLGELVAINSVAWVDPTPQAPYGSGPAAALDYMLRLCDQLGFRTKNCDGRVGWAEIGQGDEMVGILCHLDVVPAGRGGTIPPSPSPWRTAGRTAAGSPTTRVPPCAASTP